MTNPLSEKTTLALADVHREMANWEPPMPADVVAKLPKRERLEIVKPILRLHDAMPSKGMGGRRGEEGCEMRDDPRAERRWSWIYEALGERGGNSGNLGQARQEVAAEDEHGHYWSPAWGSVRVIENGLAKYEAEIHYPRRIRHGESRYTRSEDRQFATRGGADRWIARKKRAYEKYVLRLIREGVYDSYDYER